MIASPFKQAKSLKHKVLYGLARVYLFLKIDFLFLDRKDRLVKFIFAVFPWIYPLLSRWFWDRIGGKHYYKRVHVSARHLGIQYYLSTILRTIKFNSLLEVGCGTGDNLVYLKRQFPDKIFVGCDFSKKQIEVAKTHPDIKFNIADAKDLPYEDRAFDIVLTVGCLVHIPPKYIQQCADELQRVAKIHILIFEEDKLLTNSIHIWYLKRGGWHFLHDYERMFKEFTLKARLNNFVGVEDPLHTHIYLRKEYET